LTSKTRNRRLDALIDWNSTYCRYRDRTDGIPLVDGRPFRVTTRQFRRILAWFIARRPGGAIAGAIQYRGLSIRWSRATPAPPSGITHPPNSRT
jgi:hypothetical protein